MKPFTKNEITGIFLILLAVFLATFFNMQIAIRRARDAQRREDLGNIADALESYHGDFGFFPPVVDGKILACKGDNFEEVHNKLLEEKQFDRELFFQGIRACEWGKDTLENPLTGVIYLPVIPGDSQKDDGVNYYYLSNTQRFQVYTYLEGGIDETGYDAGIVRRDLPCGVKICNFGKAYGSTPVDQSIEDYENLLLEKIRTGDN